MKTVRISELSDKEQWEAINEVKLLASMDSPFVVRYYDSFINKENLAIIMEFCNKGDLARLIKKAKSSGVTSLLENVIWNISLQVNLCGFICHIRLTDFPFSVVMNNARFYLDCTTYTLKKCCIET